MAVRVGDHGGAVVPEIDRAGRVVGAEALAAFFGGAKIAGDFVDAAVAVPIARVRIQQSAGRMPDA